jgi:hypothetical protein
LGKLPGEGHGPHKGHLPPQVTSGRVEGPDYKATESYPNFYSFSSEKDADTDEEVVE